MKARRQIPYEFVIEQLARLDPYTRPMFGCESVYVDDKIVFILRRKDNYEEDNGVWIATYPEHHDSLKKDFPSMRSIRLFGDGPTAWQVLPEESPDFEESVTRACELVLAGDRRIGKIPDSRKPKAGGKLRPKRKSKRKA